MNIRYLPGLLLLYPLLAFGQTANKVIDVYSVSKGNTDFYASTQAAMAACGEYKLAGLCTYDYRGFNGTALTVSQGLVINQPGIFLLPASKISMRNDHYTPMIMIDNFAPRVKGPVWIEGQGMDATVLSNATLNDTIVDRNTSNTAFDLRISGMTIQHLGEVCNGYGSEIVGDGGLPNGQNARMVVSNTVLQGGRFGLRNATGYFNQYSNLRLLGCEGLDLEGGDHTLTNIYADLHSNGWIGTSYWMGEQFIANAVYQKEMWVIPRDVTIGYVYRVAEITGDARTGSAPPDWCTSVGCTVTSGNVTFKNYGPFAWEWWPHFKYPKGSYVTPPVASGGWSNMIFHTDQEGTSGTKVPNWNAHGTTSDGDLSWTNTGQTQYARALGSPPASVVADNIYLEENPGGSCVALTGSGSRYTINNLTCSDYSGWGITDGEVELVLNGGSVGSTPSFGGVRIGGNAGLITFNGTRFTASGGSGTGLFVPCQTAATAVNLNGVVISGWETNRSIATAASCAGFSAKAIPVNETGPGGFSTNFAFNVTQAANKLSGATAGALYWLQVAGGTYQKYSLNFQGYQNTGAIPQTVKFPNPFNYIPAPTGNCPRGLSLSSDAAMLPTGMPSSFTGQCFVEGQ